MNEALARALYVLACPDCGATLSYDKKDLTCAGPVPHSFDIEHGIPRFGEPEVPEKYLGEEGEERARKYAGMISYAYETLHYGGSETLYRSVSSLIAECLSATRDDMESVIVSAGCGVGREAADAAQIIGDDGLVIALDGSPVMVDFAHRILLGRSTVELSRPDLGFDDLQIAGRALRNVVVAQADAEVLPIASGVADVAMSIFMVDRLPHGLHRAVRECFRILRPGGQMIFANPFNWTRAEQWREYSDPDAILREMADVGFTVDTWYDDVPFQELKDARRSFDTYRAMIVKARKQG